MCGKNATTTSTSAPNPQAMSAYQNLLGRAENVANLPFQTYGGEFVAPINQQQQLGIGNINQNWNYAQPAIQQGMQYANQAAQPISSSDIQRYLDPWTANVIGATEAQFNQQNAIQQMGVTGNAAAQGALGGDRVGVAQALTAGQQQQAEAPVIAGLQTQGYNTALQTALREQQNLGQAAYSLGNLGVAGQNAALTGANAQLGAGTLEQSTQQAQDTALYNQFLAQQGFPYQQTQWLAGIDTGVGSQMGGTSQTTGPAPNTWGQIAGLGIAGLGLLNRGGRVYRDAGGRIRGFDLGGTPYAGGASYVPTIGDLKLGRGAPQPPGLPSQGQGQQQSDPFKLASSTLDLGKKLKGLGSGGLFGGSDVSLDEATQAGAEAGLSPEELGFGAGGEDFLGGASIFRRGGRIAGFAAGGYADGGGDDSFEDRFSGAGYDPYVDELQRYSALNGLRNPGESVSGGGLGLGDIMTTPSSRTLSASSGSPRTLSASSSSPDMPIMLPMQEAPSLAGPATSGKIQDQYVNPLQVNGQPQNLTGDIIPPGGTGGAPAPDLPPPADVPSRRVAGVGTSPMSFAPAPELAPSRGGDDTSAKQSGFGGLFGNPLHLSPDMRKAMLAAGFGMMASRSPYLGNVIGEGGLAGLSAYTGAQKEEFNEQQAIEKLHQSAKQAADKLALDTKRLQQQEEHQHFLERTAQERLEQGKYTMVPGMGTGPEGTPVPGAYKFNTKTGEPTFMPGITPAGKGGAGTGTAFSDDTINMMAQAIRAGNTQVLTNLGAGAMKAENVAKVWNKVAELTAAEGGTGGDLAAARANFNAQMGAAKSQAVREANVAANIAEAKKTFPLAIEASDHLPRGQFVPWTRLVQMVQAGTSSPELAQFYTAVQGVITAYSQAMARAGIATVDGRHAAEKLLNTAQGPDAFKAVLGQMSKEMQAAKAAPEEVRQEILSRISGRPAATAAGNAPTGGGRSAIDQQALDWANANPNDQRAAEIKRRLGIQ